MNLPLTRRPVRSLGFSLIEVMVGLVLGILTILVIAQVSAFAESHKRSTTSGSDAQTNGALALFSLQRDVQASGYGLSVAINTLGCTVNGEGSSGTALQFPLVPTFITFGAAGVSDQITVLSSSKAGFSLPTRVTENHPQTADTFVVQSTLGINPGDVLVAAPETWSAAATCTVFNATTAPGSTLTATSLPHQSNSNGPWNHSALLPAAGYAAGSVVLNLGTLSRRTYTVNAAGALQETAVDATGAATTQELYPQIVVLRALYGKDTSGDGNVDSYDAVTPTTAAGWRQVVAVRIAVVARSAQFEKEDVTSVEPAWDVGAALPVADAFGAATDCKVTSRCLTLGISGLTDWRRYRYKVYDTVVPLRNVVWNS